MARKKKSDDGSTPPTDAPSKVVAISSRKKRKTALKPSKTKVAKLEFAYFQLGQHPDTLKYLTDDIVAQSPQITPILKAAFKKGVDEAIGYIRISSSDKARKFLKMYDSLSVESRSVLPIEAYCIMLKMAPVSLLSVIMEACYSTNRDVSALMASVAQPEITKRTITAAKRVDGFKDRQMLHQHAGFLPQNKNTTVFMRSESHTTINDNRQQAVSVSVGELNRTEDDILKINNDYDGSIGMRAQLPPAIEPAMDVEVVAENAREVDVHEVEFADEPDIDGYHVGD